RDRRRSRGIPRSSPVCSLEECVLPLTLLLSSCRPAGGAHHAISETGFPPRSWARRTWPSGLFHASYRRAQPLHPLTRQLSVDGVNGDDPQSLRGRQGI